MTKLAETYIHLKIDATDDFQREVREYLYELSQGISYQIFGQETQIDISFEDGSWKTWIAVAGAIYIGIGQYGSFRSGIEFMVKDARKFSNVVTQLSGSITKLFFDKPTHCKAVSMMASKMVKAVFS